MRRVIRYTRSQIAGIGALDKEQIRAQLHQLGFDLTQPIQKMRDIDSVYYVQGEGKTIVPSFRVTAPMEVKPAGRSLAWQ